MGWDGGVEVVVFVVEVRTGCGVGILAETLAVEEGWEVGVSWEATTWSSSSFNANATDNPWDLRTLMCRSCRKSRRACSLPRVCLYNRSMSPLVKV